MGADYRNGEYLLRRFDQYCADHLITTMTRRACEGFVAQEDTKRVSLSRDWVACLRGFARWMRIHGDPEAFVLPDCYSPHTPRPETYLITDTEIEVFFAAAAVFTGRHPWSWQATAFFAVMCCLGLRTGETRKLDRCDIDFAKHTITVRESKGSRTRVLPMTVELVETLAACDEKNHRVWPDRQPFFVSSKGTRLVGSRPAAVFKHIWAAAQLPFPSTPPFPRPYCFRHHFAYANLERWAADGRDTPSRLPYLARFMGHCSPRSTLYYLHVSPDFITTWDTTVHPSAGLLPEAGFDD
jgi:integrase